jgi:hypothetical protein
MAVEVIRPDVFSKEYVVVKVDKLLGHTCQECEGQAVTNGPF